MKLEETVTWRQVSRVLGEDEATQLLQAEFYKDNKDFDAPEGLSGAFVWDQTLEGHCFWELLNSEITDYSRIVTETKIFEILQPVLEYDFLVEELLLVLEEYTALHNFGEERAVYLGSGVLSSGFSWRGTSQGYEFWNTLNEWL